MGEHERISMFILQWDSKCNFFIPRLLLLRSSNSIVEWIQVCSVMMILAHFLLLLSLVCFVVVCRDMACYNVRSVVCRGWRYALACCDSDALLF